MSSKFFRLLALFTVLAMILSPLNAKPTLAVTSPEDTLQGHGSFSVNNKEDLKAIDEVSSFKGNGTSVDVSGNVFGVSETGLYIVRLKDPSLAMYQGGIGSLAATSPQTTGFRKLDVKSPESVAYLNYLNGEQAEFVSAMEGVLGRAVEVVYIYKNVLNALDVRVSHEEAMALAKLESVKAVYGDKIRELDTDVGPIWIGAPAIWDGDTGTGEATQGEGVTIGVIDGGINHAHPSFADPGGDGYDHTNPFGSGVYVGYCIANPSFCNDKLIGAYDLYPGGSGGPEDTFGHGSHTASTAGGNRHEAVFMVGTEEFTRTIQGVAPHANIIAYKVCLDATHCSGSASVAAVDHAIQDEVDVLNYSISGGDDPWNDPVDQAFLDAFAAGIYVSASAGNSGPGASTVAHTGPWNASVGASTHNRIYSNLFEVTGPITVPGELQNIPSLQGNGTALVADIEAEISYSATNLSGCSAFPAGFFLDKLALIQRGGCGFSVKITNAYNAGADAVVIFNNAGGPPSEMDSTGAPAIPSVMVPMADGLAVMAFIDANPGATAALRADVNILFDDDWYDIMAGFSSRGPSKFELIKPDFVAPGVNILAAIASAGGDPVQYDFYQGTSMSSPHGAGAGALMVALHPSWSPAQIKSALSTSAFNGSPVIDSDGVTPADLFDMGSGRLALAAAGNVGLVLDETAVNFQAADPATGGDPKILNLPSFKNNACYQTCSWTRTVYNPTDTSMTWEASYSGEGIAAVTPMNFTVSAGETATFTIKLDVYALSPDTWYFGSLTWSEAAGLAPDTKMPMAVFPVRTTNADVIEKAVSHDFASVGDTLTYTITVKNWSEITQTYTLTDPVPTHTDYINGSATGGLVYHPVTDTLTWSGKVGPFGLSILEGFDSGYVSLAGLGVSPYPLPADTDNGGWIIPDLDFYYLGQHYDRVIWSINGTVEAGSASGSAAPGGNTSLPNPLLPNNLLAAWWTDLDLTSAGHWYAAGVSDGVDDYTVFEWEDVPRHGDLASTATFQVWFRDGTDDIWFAYPANTFTGVTSDGTIGAENSDGTLGSVYYYDGTGTLPDGSDDLLVIRIPSTAVLTYQAEITEMDTEVNNTVEVMDNLAATAEAFALTQLGVPPEVTFTSNTPVMLGETAVFIPTVTGTGPFEYLWAFGDSTTSTLEAPTPLYAATGTYTVTLLVTSNWGDDTYESVFVVVGVPPEVTFTSNTPVTLGEVAVFTPTVTGTGPFEYLWDFRDTITSTLPSPTHTYGITGTYMVTLTVTSDWGTDTYAAAFVVNARPLAHIYLPIVFKASTP
jgi:uncharacterized repeat protein (TIGR01451 family)